MRTTWILIANASQARLFKAEKSTKNMELIALFFHPQSRERTVDLVSDVPGRYRNGISPKSNFEEATSPKQHEIESFAHELAEKLNEGRNKNLYKNLIVIAPSHFQGLLNKFCNSHVKNLIITTLHKDYTKVKEHDLLHYLDGKVNLRRAA